jgi:zinc D-Ala-D-Ala carboxypeptidase
MLKNNKFMFLKVVGSLAVALAFIAVGPSNASAETYSSINSNTTLRVGSKGDAVRFLQTFMASSPAVYPSGTVDGNFGPNTKAGVVQFQVAFGLVPDGLAGRNTITKINGLISVGQGLDINAPKMNALVVGVNGRNANVSFYSDEPVKVNVFYDTNLINWNNWNDGVMSLATPNISGLQSSDNTFSTNKQFTISNLSPNSMYHYVIVITDESGNSTVTWPAVFTSGN